MRPYFTLAVVSSSDGFIARGPGHTPAEWASAEEQALFSAEVAAADWAIMGRRTHEAVDRPNRHRVVLSTVAGTGEWRRPTQLWLDPADSSPAKLAPLTAHVRPLRGGLILGGTRVHDWFRDAGAIDRVHLTVEPVTFGMGLPIFGDQMQRDPVAAFEAAGFAPVSERRLNSGGTRHLALEPRAGGSTPRHRG